MNKLANLITRSIAEHSSRTALICGERRLRFAEVGALTARIAGELRASGVKKGERVAILLPNCPEYVCTDFALIRLGLVRVPINPRLAAPEVAFILNDCEAAALVCSAEHASLVEAILPDLPVLRHVIRIDRLPEEGPVLTDAEPVCDDDPYMILYTSGTTGRPKGAVTTFGSRWVTLFHLYANEGSVSRDDVMLHAASLAHGSGTKVLPFFVKGAANVLMPKFTPAEFCRLVERERVTHSWMVPTTISMILEAPERADYDLSSLRQIVYAGAPMPAERLKQALEAFGEIFVQVYGLSEAPQPDLVLTREDHRLPDKLASAGRPALGVQVRVVRPDGTEVKPGSDEVGEIALRGPHIMSGYWRRPDATAEALRDGWFHTGDLARVDSEGYIFIVDRAKEMIISGGYNIYPREVEEALYRHPAISEAAVIGVPDERWGEAVKACVVTRPGASVTSEELIAHCAQLLAGYKKPRTVDFLPALPKSPNGKIAKLQLRAPYWEGRERKV